jgi:ribonucleoside-diphosphate reductase alpha chain
MIAREGTEIGSLLDKAREIWEEILKRAPKSGVRNSQVTLMAPTGTVSIMMDCATTGIEAGFWLTTEKTLVDGGHLFMPLTSIPLGLDALGYEDLEKEKILEHVKTHHMIEGAPGLKETDLAVFDTTYPNGKGKRVISSDGHLLMLAAVQGFVSGGISNTIGCPKDTIKEEFRRLIVRSWKIGLKGITVYRDGSKVHQPISGAGKAAAGSPGEYLVRSQKKKLPRTRPAINHAFRLGMSKCYLDVGFYPEDRKVGEIFVSMAKQGSSLRGLLEALSLSVSIGLQHQIPLIVYVEKMIDMNFDPKGWTDNDNIRSASSVVDYIFKFLAQFDEESSALLGGGTSSQEKMPKKNPAPETNSQTLGDVCPQCGSLMIRVNGTCKRCAVCLFTEGTCG